MEDIHVDKREVTGRACKTLRRQGITPAVIYGYKQNLESKNIQLSEEALREVMVRLNSARPIQLELEEDVLMVLTKDITSHPVTGEILHVDFMAVDEKTPVTVLVHTVLTGISPAVKNNIGVLVHELDQVRITCLPDYIPDQIDIDISELKVIGDNILVKDLKLPKEITISDKELKRTVVTIAKAQKVIEETTEATPEEGAEEGEGTDEVGEEAATGKEGETTSNTKSTEGKAEEKK